MVKVLGMRYDFGREIVEGDMSPLASALMPVWWMACHADWVLAQRWARGCGRFVVGMETGLQHAHMGAVMDPNVADTVPQTCGADDDDSRYYDVY